MHMENTVWASVTEKTLKTDLGKVGNKKDRQYLTLSDDDYPFKPLSEQLDVLFASAPDFLPATTADDLILTQNLF